MKAPMTLICGVAVLGFASLASAGDAIQPSPGYSGGWFDITMPQSGVLWDNAQIVNPPNGVSNATAAPFGARRTVLDDFVVDGPGWILQDFHWLHLWNGGGSNLGTGLELSFRADAGGTPGAVIGSAVITSYNEQPTGRVFFSRPEMKSDVTMQDFVLMPGTYWIEATIVGPENNFWLVDNHSILNPMWLNYDDFGGLQPGINVFGADYDLNFVITGVLIPAPSSLALLGLGALVARRRR